MLEVSHIVVNGCSWTYGQGLANPSKDAWPALLSKKLNIPIVNIAMPGSGNDSIFRRSSQYLFKNLPTNSKPLFIIAWSHIDREEAWNIHEGRYRGITCTDVNNLSLREKAYIENFNSYDRYLRSLSLKISMIAILNTFNIPYMIGDYENSAKDFIEGEATASMKYQLREMVDFINNNTTVWKTPLIDYTLGVTKLPCGHEDVAGHRLICENLYNVVLNVYKDIRHTPCSYINTSVFKHINKDFAIEAKTFSVWL